MRIAFSTLVFALSLFALGAAFVGCGHERWRPGYGPVVGLAMEHVLEVHTRQLRMIPGQSEPVMMDAGTGSAVIVDRRGYLVTCFHVVKECQEIAVEVNSANQNVTAVVVATDPDLDMALLKIDMDLPDVATWGNSSTLMPGDVVFVVGFPFHLGKMAGIGIVTSINMVIHYPIVTTDAPLNPGDSGGGLFDGHGDLVGLNDLMYSPCGASIGIGGCIPGNTVRLFVNRHLPLE